MLLVRLQIYENFSKNIHFAYTFYIIYDNNLLFFCCLKVFFCINLFKDGELQQETTVAKIATVVNRGIRGEIEEQVTVSWQQESEPVTNRHRLITR